MPMNANFEEVQEGVQTQTKQNQGAWELDFSTGNFLWSVEMFNLLHCHPSSNKITQGFICDQ